ncbi:hypothetical protein EUGRSUZ_H04761 [Eucalyptus grandis]|uniref:Uncharacterized protein n=2 Tax=Eucalyptus grandis TaxID=71139 RepID=A0ACC3JXR7_EUCGR|nr:hypothetical protein EUGRSUZ_H04761 [Eucalyptus grandis]
MIIIPLNLLLQMETSLMNLSKSLKDGPPRPAASTALSFHFLAFSLIFFPPTPSITSRTRASISSRLTSWFTSMPIPHSVHEYRQFVCCLAKNGQQMRGTPPQVASKVEFHPQCVRKAPIDP